MPGQTKDKCQVLEAIRQERPELVLLDVGMPGCSGWRSRRVRADPHLKETRIVLLTGANALAVLRQRHFDLILLDLLLAGGSGQAVIDDLRPTRGRLQLP